MNEITMEKVQELMEDAAFMQKIQNAKELNEKLQVLSDYGIIISEEELRQGCDQVYAMFEEKGYVSNGELTEKAMDMVAGGYNRFASIVGTGAGAAGLALAMAGGGPVAWSMWGIGCLVGFFGAVC